MKKQDKDDRPMGVTTRAGGIGVVPIGLEKVLYRAAIDGGFRHELLTDRLHAVQRVGNDLSPTEQSILQSIPEATLSAMISGLRPQQKFTRKFMKAVATAVLLTAAGTAPATLFMACANAGIPVQFDIQEDIQERTPIEDIAVSDDSLDSTSDVAKSDESAEESRSEQ
jgi:hypothetical protein